LEGNDRIQEIKENFEVDLNIIPDIREPPLLKKKKGQ
jgi:hypothetical protein